MDNSAIALLLKGLNADEVRELVSIADYLHEKANSQDGYMPEGSVASLLNGASPKVREKFLHLSEALETPRFAPFQPERSEAERAEEFGLDPNTTVTIKAAIDGQHVAHGLQKRMGTDAQLPRTPPSMTDLLSAAYDKHSGA